MEIKLSLSQDEFLYLDGILNNGAGLDYADSKARRKNILLELALRKKLQKIRQVEGLTRARIKY